MSLFKLVRIVALLSILFVILVGSWMAERRLASWERPIWVTLYPIVAEQNAGIRDYAKRIDADTYGDINRFFARELRLYGVELNPPVNFQIAEVSETLPPLPPENGSPAAVAMWSLKMRWWAWNRQRSDDLVASDIQMFVLYHRPGGPSELKMSVGMRKGMYGLVKAYSGAYHEPRNQVVIAHELLHVLGASDKYSPATGNPEHPIGYADPDQVPLFPQTRAEIMGGRIPLNAFDSVMPESLEKCRIGRRTAEEIGLFDKLVDT